MSEVTTKKLLADFKTLVDDAEGLVKATADQAGERLTELRQRLAGRVEEGKAALAQGEKQWREQAEQAKRRAVTLLRDEHWDRVAICAGIGVLLGLALRCRRKESKRSES
jgi:ElaB/YqjD/DUF883 family membrane-anchored ribosome-binding protein